MGFNQPTHYNLVAASVVISLAEVNPSGHESLDFSLQVNDVVTFLVVAVREGGQSRRAGLRLTFDPLNTPH